MIFKVNFEKAYDCIYWDYLFSIMGQMGFSSNWIGWNRACISSASISVLFNGSPTKEFRLGEGLGRVIHCPRFYFYWLRKV